MANGRGNTGLPFGLCKKYGISLPENATPREAWEAIKKKTGLDAQVFFEDHKDAKKYNAPDFDNMISFDKGPSALSRAEWAMYYQAISDKKLGHCFPKIRGMDAIRIGKKIILSSGTFEDPIVEHVLVLGSTDTVDKFMERLRYDK